ncbi:MAG: RpiB/LacA/LacB family sugar-phosphate isomerase [Patescibacteria group bacterium]|nr:RpiB/LacA/LacB family sugar-phosphate isomerase [Patescibacteria group bacterium]
MVVYIASDHGGFELKEKLKIWFAQNQITLKDLGADELRTEDDYPDYIFPLAQKVVSGHDSLGIIIGRSGNGEAIAANKVKGIRCAVCLNEQMAKKAREDNNANILSLGADYINFDQAKNIIETFLETPFSAAERHVRRLQKIEDFEQHE